MFRTRFARFAWAVLWANIAVILWGAVVRATGSGAGCGSNWPLCNGEVLPRSPTVETLIELSHRATAGLALLLVVGLAVWAYRAFGKGHPVRHWATAALVLMLGEAAIGAGLVLFELVAENQSMARAMFMATHLANTFLLLAALTLTAQQAAGGAPVSPRGRGRLAWLCLAGLAASLLIGASGAVAALGDTLFPAGSLKEALAQDLALSSHLLIRLRLLHPLIAVCGGLLLLYLAAEVRRRRSGPARRHANQLSLLVFIQLAAGGLNILILAPVWMQLVHLLLADLLWISLVLTAATALAEPARAEPARAQPATGLEARA